MCLALDLVTDTVQLEVHRGCCSLKDEHNKLLARDVHRAERSKEAPMRVIRGQPRHEPGNVESLLVCTSQSDRWMRVHDTLRFLILCMQTSRLSPAGLVSAALTSTPKNFAAVKHFRGPGPSLLR